TDINLIPRYSGPRRMILSAASKASGLIAVSQALKDAMVALGIPQSAVTVLRNGVDLELFNPGGREQARAQLACTGKVLLSVGLLIDRKGHNFVIEALKSLPNDYS